MKTRRSISIDAKIWKEGMAWCRARGKKLSALLQDLLESHLRSEQDRELRVRAEVARYGDPLPIRNTPETGEQGRVRKNGNPMARRAS